MSVRVPTPVVSLSDFVIVTKKAITIEDVNEAFKKAAAEPFYQGILAVTEEELVSTDFIGNSHSAIVDLALTNVVGGNLLKVVAWYDNEWGYSNRLVELTADTGRLLNGNNDNSETKSEEAAMPTVNNTDTTDNTEPQEPKDEKLLGAPTVGDFLPPPVGQTDDEPHMVKEEHTPVEGAPGLETPADTLPEQGPPAIFPDAPIVGPDKPHEF
jgi:hypothetical protein